MKELLPTKAAARLFRAALLAGLLAGTCLAQPQSQVVDIEVQGKLRKVAESLIRSTISLKPGIELSQDNVQQAVRDLQALGVFSDIQIYGVNVPAGVKVIIVVEEYPTLAEIRFKGQKNIKEKEMKDALGLVAGQVVAPRDAVRGEQKIAGLYREKGYLQAEVKGQFFDAEEEGKVFLQYEIKEGEKVKIERIDLKVHHADGTVVARPVPRYVPRHPGSFRQEAAELDVGMLKRQMKTKEKRWWGRGEFKKETYEEDKEKLLTFCRGKGYQQASFLRDSVYYDESRKKLSIDLDIEAGRQYRLGKVGWDGNTLFADEELARKLRIGRGDLYRFSGAELADLVRLAYYDQGYLDTRVVPAESARGDTMDVAFQVFEGKPWKIRRIDIAGNTKTREKVIRREIELRPGDIYQQS
jgi:outer membrane protein insertion porin family